MRDKQVEQQEVEVQEVEVEQQEVEVEQEEVGGCRDKWSDGVKGRRGLKGASGKGVVPVACLLELQELLGSLAEFCHLLLVWHMLLMVRMLLQLLQAFLQ